MTVLVQDPVIEYIANGSVTEFAYPFRVLQTVDLKVFVDSIEVASGFTVAGIDDPSGGSVTFTVPPVNNAVVRLQRIVTLERQTDYIQGGAMNAEVLDRDMDRVVQQVQDLDRVAFKEDSTGQLNADARRLTNVGDPVDEQDVVTKVWAETSATAQLSGAIDAANAAAASQAAAFVSETNASTSETNASTSETNAATSASNAAISADAAWWSANDAGISAAMASTSETNAAISESNAYTSAANASTSLNAAVIAAGNASTSAANALTSETNAATSETNAAASATDAQNAVILLTSYPTEYFTGNGVQTVFTLTYSPVYESAIIVSVAGVIQQPKEYDVTGSTLTFFTAPPSSDPDNIEVRYLGVSNIGVAPEDHGALTGLADDDHTQYHNDTRGDARYFTQTQLNAGQLDTRYYTETEVNSLLSGKSDTSHNHDANYYTQAQVDTMLSASNELAEMTDVTITGPIADNEVLAYDTTSGKFINQTPAEAFLAQSNHQHSNYLDTGTSIIKIGSGSDATVGGIAIGLNAGAVLGGSGINIGQSSDAAGTGVAVGHSANANQERSVVFGQSANADVIGGVALGPSTLADASYSIMIGDNYSASKKLIRMNSTGGLTLVGTAAQYIAPNYTTAGLPAGSSGGIVYDQTVGKLKYSNGAAWSEVGSGGVSDHTLLSNIGTNTHAQIDSHLGDTSIHYPMNTISITESQISDFGTYEPAFTKNTGFNLNVGTTVGTVAAGDHNHSGVYEPADATILKDADIGVNVAAQSHAHTFLSLTDSPADYTGSAGKLVKVNPTGDGLIFGDPSGSTVSWGDIAGTLSSQTDLQSALDGKSSTTHNHDASYQPLDGDLTAIAGLAGTSGILTKTAADTWALDTNTYSTTSHDHSGVYEPADATILKDADIGVNVAAFSHNHDSVYAALSHTHEGTTIDATGVTDGYVLTADGLGNAAWEAAAAGGGGADPRIASVQETMTYPPTVGGTTAARQLAIGEGAVIAYNFSDCIAIGAAYANNTNGIAIGTGLATIKGAKQTYAIAMGSDARVDGSSGIGIGRNAYVSNTNGISIGYYSQATNTDATAVGSNSSATNTNATAVGTLSRAYGSGSTAIGRNSHVSATGTYAIAIGQNASSTGFGALSSYAIAIGASTTASGNMSITIGYSSSTSGADGIAIGRSRSAAADETDIGSPNSSLKQNSTGALSLSGSASQFVLPSYTVTTLPTGVTGGMILVTDESGGATPAFFDGTNWRRVHDLAIVS